MLFKVHAKVELFCGVHSKALALSFTETVDLDYFKVLSDFRFNPNQAIEKLSLIK